MRVPPKTVFAYSGRMFLAVGALFLVTSATLHITREAGNAYGSQDIANAWNKLCFDAPNAASNNESGSEDVFKKLAKAPVSETGTKSKRHYK